PILETLDHHADAARKRRGAGHDPVGRGADVVAAAGCQVFHVHDYGLAALAELDDLVVDVVAGGDTAARAVDLEDHGAHLRVLFGLVQAVDGQRHRVNAAAEQSAATALHDHAFDADHGDLAAFSRLAAVLDQAVRVMLSAGQHAGAANHSQQDQQVEADHAHKNQHAQDAPDVGARP